MESLDLRRWRGPRFLARLTFWLLVLGLPPLAGSQGNNRSQFSPSSEASVTNSDPGSSTQFGLDQELNAALKNWSEGKLDEGVQQLVDLAEAGDEKDHAKKVLRKLYGAMGLSAYFDNSRWQIRQREKIQTTEKVPVHRWSVAQIREHIDHYLAEALTERDLLQGPDVATVLPYFEVNTLPAEVRPWLMDRVAAVAGRIWLDTSLWTATEEVELAKTSVADLLSGNVAALSSQHPARYLLGLYRINAQAHLAKGQVAAYLECEYELFSAIYRWQKRPEDRALVLRALKDLQDKYSHRAIQMKMDWWAKGQHLLARWWRDQPGRGSLITAMKEAQIGIAAFPQSVMGLNCRNEAHVIEQPEFSISVMTVENKDKASVWIEGKNLKTVYFRVFALSQELMEKVDSSRQDLRNYLNQGKNLSDLSQPPLRTWTSSFTDPGDYQSHRFEVSIKDLPWGSYLVQASLQPDFQPGNTNLVAESVFRLSDLILAVEPSSFKQSSIRVVSGITGKAIAGAQVRVERHRSDFSTDTIWKAQTAKTDSEGRVHFQWMDWKEMLQKAIGHQGGWQNVKDHFFVSHQWQSAYATSQQSGYPDRIEKHPRKALVVFDRAIFRPQQKLFWKVLSFEGSADQRNWKAKKNEKLTARFVDPNGETRWEGAIVTNSFGSAAGEFVVPEGGRLGRWSLTLMDGNQKEVGAGFFQVEEYKRPTFAVEFSKEAVPRFWGKATFVKGEARSYFGSPVQGAKFKWSVSRANFVPWWRDYGIEGGGAVAVASGEGLLNDLGQFEFNFVPEKVSSSSNYQFNIKVTVTDPAGETQEGTSQFRLGNEAFGLVLQESAATPFAGEMSKINVSKQNLNNEKLAGQGHWYLYQVEAPSQALLPADMPMMFPPTDGLEDPEKEWSGPSPQTSQLTTAPGSRLIPEESRRPRWETSVDWSAISRSWPRGDEVARGEWKTSENQAAELSSPVLSKAGYYRWVVVTVDNHGREVKSQTDFLVGGTALKTPLPLLVLKRGGQPIVSSATELAVGETLELLLASGQAELDVECVLERKGQGADEREIIVRKVLHLTGAQSWTYKVTPEDRGMLMLYLTAVKDHQPIQSQLTIDVPWADKRYQMSLVTFRDRIRPKMQETIQVTIKDSSGRPIKANTAEVLALMYDQSLEALRPYYLPSPLALYPTFTSERNVKIALDSRKDWARGRTVDGLFTVPSFRDDSLKGLDVHLFQAPGSFALEEGESFAELSVMPAPEPTQKREQQNETVVAQKNAPPPTPPAASSAEPPVRTDFRETAFFKPHLLVDGNGNVSFEYEVPDSLTAWRLWLQAVSTDAVSGEVSGLARSALDLMVRPQLPRFLREGDEAELRVTVNNTSHEKIDAHFHLDVLEKNQDFGLPAKGFEAPISIPAQGSKVVSVKVKTPMQVGFVKIKATVRSANFADAELRELPILPSRVHLAESKLVFLSGIEKKEMQFSLATQKDPTRQSEGLVVQVEGQLLNGVVAALPYLMAYPYECIEQLANRYIAAGIVSDVFAKHPGLAQMAQQESKTSQPLKSFDSLDENLKKARMSVEETPWLQYAKGAHSRGDSKSADSLNLLDARNVTSVRNDAIQKIQARQNSDGGFPWFAGGMSDPYMTLHFVMTMGRAQEFGLKPPPDLMNRAWIYLQKHISEEKTKCLAEKSVNDRFCQSWTALLLYALESSPDAVNLRTLIPETDRQELFGLAMKSWQKQSVKTKSYLAQAYFLRGEVSKAQEIWKSVMDRAISDPLKGTYWAPEAESWHWYNDTIEGHALALRMQTLLAPQDPRNTGLVQWLFLNKKLNQWSSTRSTAEVIYALVKYLEKEKVIGISQKLRVQAGSFLQEMELAASDRVQKNKKQWVLDGDQAQASKVLVEQKTPGMAFASAQWFFSTEGQVQESASDFYHIQRAYFLREMKGGENQLRPLSGKDLNVLKVGDEVEVQLRLRSKHASEYVLVRDPRPAGFEPVEKVSQYQWDQGLGRFQEIRDQATNFFINWLPAGEYTLRYRMRVSMSGNLRVGPATLLSIYSPDLSAHSASEVLRVHP